MTTDKEQEAFGLVIQRQKSGASEVDNQINISPRRPVDQEIIRARVPVYMAPPPTTSQRENCHHTATQRGLTATLMTQPSGMMSS